jgi:hypothetical protein
MRSRPLPVTVAAILMALFSLLNLLFPLLPTEDIPILAVVVYGVFVLGVAGLVATAGLWLLREWSIWLTIVVSVLNVVAAAPGMTELVIVLVVLLTSRRAFASS